MKAKPGTYALVLNNCSHAFAKIGRWGTLAIQPGYYIYVGSAFGPGGVRARVARHCRDAESMHWHIDYLRKYTTPLSIWYSHAPVHLEHQWAAALAKMKDIRPVEGFGCTDCKCESHLFFSARAPKPAALARTIRRVVKSCTCEDIG